MAIKTDPAGPRARTPQSRPPPDLPGSARAKAPANVPAPASASTDAFQAPAARPAAAATALDGSAPSAAAGTGSAVLDQSLRSLATMGAQKQPNGDVSFKYWAPDAQAVSVKVQGKDGEQLVPM